MIYIIERRSSQFIEIFSIVTMFRDRCRSTLSPPRRYAKSLRHIYFDHRLRRLQGAVELSRADDERYRVRSLIRQCSLAPPDATIYVMAAAMPRFRGLIKDEVNLPAVGSFVYTRAVLK